MNMKNIMITTFMAMCSIAGFAQMDEKKDEGAHEA